MKKVIDITTDKLDTIHLASKDFYETLEPEEHTELIHRFTGGKFMRCCYCERQFAWVSSRGTHESRCPSLKNIPNTVHYLKNTLKSIQARIKDNGLSKGQARY